MSPKPPIQRALHHSEKHRWQSGTWLLIHSLNIRFTEPSPCAKHSARRSGYGAKSSRTPSTCPGSLQSSGQGRRSRSEKIIKFGIRPVQGKKRVQTVWLGKQEVAFSRALKLIKWQLLEEPGESLAERGSRPMKPRRSKSYLLKTKRWWL